MPYVKIEPGYPDDPKTVRLKRLLETSVDYPVRLWCYVGRHHYKAGEMRPYDAAALEAAVGWDGEKGKAESALIEAGYIERIEAGYRVCDWPKIGGHIQTFKERAKKGGRGLWNKKPGG